MEEQYYMIKGMLGEFSEADQAAVKEGSDAVRQSIVDAVKTIQEKTKDSDKMDSEAVASIIFAIGLWESAKELGIEVG